MADPGTGLAPGQYVSPAANTCYSNYAVALLPFLPLPNGAVTGDKGRVCFLQAFKRRPKTSRDDPYGLHAWEERFPVWNIPQRPGKLHATGLFRRYWIGIQHQQDHDCPGRKPHVRLRFRKCRAHRFQPRQCYRHNTFTPAANQENIPCLANDTTVDAIPGQTASRLSLKGRNYRLFPGGTNSGSRYLHVWNSYRKVLR